MKVLLSNKFYYYRGGDCICTINLSQLLKKHGHEVAIFSMQHPNNIKTDSESYYPTEIDFNRKSNLIKGLIRPFGSKDVKENFKKIITDFKPDIVHLHNIHTQLSPILAQLSYTHKIPVLWTLHDYKLICPRSDSLKKDVFVCNDCNNSIFNVIKYKCSKNSYLFSFIAYLEAMKWNRKKLQMYTKFFICPSRFMAKQMIDAGFDINKLIVLNNFIDIDKVSNDTFEKDDYYCYVGRISNEKGINTLIKAANQLSYKLKIVGTGPLFDDFMRIKSDNIDFLGHKDWNELKSIIARARFSVITSEWFENNPGSVIESMCLGTPVLGSKIGGIPELLEIHSLNKSFESKNVEDLKNNIQLMWDKFPSKEQYKNLSTVAQNKFNDEQYYKEILKLYKNGMDTK